MLQDSDTFGSTDQKEVQEVEGRRAVVFKPIRIPRPEIVSRVIPSWNMNREGRDFVVLRRFLYDGWPTPWRPLFQYEEGRWTSLAMHQADADKIALQPRVIDVANGKHLSLQLSFLTEAQAAGFYDASLTVQLKREVQAHLAFSADESAAWGKCLNVPCFSQFSADSEPGLYPDQDLSPKAGNRFGKVGHFLCAPTSLLMVFHYYGAQVSLLDVSRYVFEQRTTFYGVWAMNIAAVTRFLGLAGRGYAKKLLGMQDLEQEILLGYPVITPIRWKKGYLTGALQASSKGHLVVVVGFTEHGDVIVNDPLGITPDEIRRVYNRREFWRCWQGSEDFEGLGMAYIIRGIPG